MPNYATIGDVYLHYGKENTLLSADFEQTMRWQYVYETVVDQDGTERRAVVDIVNIAPMLEQRITQAIEMAESALNTRLINGAYSVPLQSVPPVVKKFVIDETYYYLYCRSHSQDGTGTNTYFKDLHEENMKWIDAIGNRLVRLEMPDDQSVTGQAPGVVDTEAGIKNRMTTHSFFDAILPYPYFFRR